MTIDVLNTGTAAGSGDGESLRSAMTKVNSNFGAAENAASKIVQASSADTTSDKVMLSDYAWRGAQLGDYFTYGGTANAITLTSANLRAGGTLIKGMKFRFEATAANTGATTIAVDGGSAISCLTPTGVALPAGFIRTDVFTECEYDGSNFVVSRKVESGSNANGEWTKWEDGTLVQSSISISASSVSINVAAAGGFRSGGGAAGTWTYPIAFLAGPVVSPVTLTPDALVLEGNPSNTSVSPTMWRAASGVVNTSWESNAVGKWY